VTDVVEQFLRASTLERLRLVSGDSTRKELRGFLGEDAFEDYRHLSESIDLEHLAPDARPSVLFCPGVMGSLIHSTTKGGVWWIDVLRTRHHHNDLRLSPDGETDADPGDKLEPFNVDTSYEPFLTAAQVAPNIGLRWFAYDWRKLLSLGADAFRDKLLELRAENGDEPLDLVGHSMGGLMIRAALMEHGDEIWPCIRRIVFVGTPHYGSPAIAGYLKNHLWGFDQMALLGLYLDRTTFRSLWGVLAMLPAPLGIYPGTRKSDPDPWKGKGEHRHPCANFDLYRAGAWHLDLSPAEEAQLQIVLDGAHDFHTRMSKAHEQLTNDQRDRILVIAGVGYKTLFRLEWSKGPLGLWERAKKITDRKRGDRHREGDGRVPLASAELDDVRVRYVKGVHGGLMNIKAVYKAVFAFLADGTLELSPTPEEALDEHLAATEATSEAPRLDGTARAEDGDPGYLDLESDETRARRNQAELEQRLLSDVQYARLL
jgi:pimeloyl-ACP methyl ester carboxylesterase